MRLALVLLSFALLQLSCVDSSVTPEDRRFNIRLSYGVGARNVFDSFRNSVTKDLVLDGTATTMLVLSQAECDSIQARVNGIDFFNYPDTFVAPPAENVPSITPYSTYILTVQLDARSKTVVWKESKISTDARSTQLRECITYIRALVEARPEYLQLPQAQGAYL
jgi:hypothetical protein